MFSLIRVSAGLAVMAGSLAVAPLSAVQAATEPAGQSCAAPAGRCDFTPGQEGVHRIKLTLPAARAEKLRELLIGGQQCPLSRAAEADGTVSLSCFAYLSGGVNYTLAVPAETPVSIIRTEPAHGEPVTLIP